MEERKSQAPGPIGQGAPKGSASLYGKTVGMLVSPYPSSLYSNTPTTTDACYMRSIGFADDDSNRVMVI
jgi:hypothetical protein